MRFPEIEMPTAMGPLPMPAFSMQITDASARRGRMRAWSRSWCRRPRRSFRIVGLLTIQPFGLRYDTRHPGGWLP